MRKILIVEDDKDMQEIYRVLFNDGGKYEIVIVGDANVALKKADAGKFDLIIHDIIMEPMPGDSFFVHARNNAKLKHVPILVVSILKQDTRHFLETLGNFHYLQKPITRESLLKKIEEILSA